MPLCQGPPGASCPDNHPRWKCWWCGCVVVGGGEVVGCGGGVGEGVWGWGVVMAMGGVAGRRQPQIAAHSVSNHLNNRLLTE